jgi:hypothetical protein
MEAEILTGGCQKCGRGSDENPHPSGWLWFVFHELKCWGLRVLAYNAAWLWTHPEAER